MPAIVTADAKGNDESNLVKTGYCEICIVPGAWHCSVRPGTVPDPSLVRNPGTHILGAYHSLGPEGYRHVPFGLASL